MEIGHDKNVDWWSLGILIYEMVTGIVPYSDRNVYIVYQNILQKPIDNFLKSSFSEDLKSLLKGLCTINP